MSEYKKPYVIAEAGCNHKGDMEIAKELINVAAMFCHADAIKFQKRCPKELLTPEQYNAPHPNPENSYGNTYGAHREFLEFTVDQHAQLKEWCEEAGITYATSVWDMTSAREITSLKPKFIKIPSACNTHYEMLQWLCDNYQGEIQLSFGMTTHEEEENIVSLFEQNGRAQDLVLFDCTSGYPVPFSDVCLLEIKLMVPASNPSAFPDITWESPLILQLTRSEPILSNVTTRLTAPGKAPITLLLWSRTV